MSYAQQSDIEAVFGPTNVAAWTLFETGTPDGATNTVRIEAALAYADGEVDAFFAGGPYAVPLTVETGAQPVVAYWAAVIAGCWLYGSRAGVSYVDYAGNRFLALKAAVYANMQLYKAGVKRLPAAARLPHTTGPTAV
jgi:phage gp36-like protein